MTETGIMVCENIARRKALGMSMLDLAKELRVPAGDILKYETREDTFVMDDSALSQRIEFYLKGRFTHVDSLRHHQLRMMELSYEIASTRDPGWVSYFTGHMMSEAGSLTMELSGHDRGRGNR